jgi:hypothetical protein
MNKTCLPSPESGFISLEDHAISLLPDGPAGYNHNFRETRAFERLLSPPQNFIVRARKPRDLQVVPNSCTKLAVEEKMPPVFI